MACCGISVLPGFDGDVVVGDKTGTGIGKTKHVYVDIAFGEPAERSPFIVASYFEPRHPAKPMNQHAVAALAAVGRIAAAARDSR